MPVLVAVLALVGSVLAVQRGWFDGSPVSTGPAASPRVQTGSPTAASPSSTSPKPSATSAGSGSATQQVLDSCRAKVGAADDVLEAAEVGIDHWAQHVQAQTDANSGKISTAKMDAIFKRTRVAGPEDVKDYEDAVQAYEDESGECDGAEKGDGGSSSVTEQVNRCVEREQALEPVLDAAEDAMQDWESHLAAMKRSRMGHVHDAEGVWLRAWRAAPPHIEAYQDAAKELDAPKC